ncbi:MAG TPA: phospholipid carrier-dependent glycosyltransferase [Thermoanaerobaculia bacterium]
MSRDRAATLLAAAALVFLSLLLVRDHARDDSLSADEPVHILSGWLEVSGRNAIVNIEHPPLAKMLAGIALSSLPIPPPPPTIPMGSDFTDFGHAFLFQGSVSPDAIAAAARAPFRGVLACLLVLLFAAAWSRSGPDAALFALALVALDPNFVAHAGVVHTDIGAALGFLATVLSWEAARRRPTLLRHALAALALGLALATKFSAILLPPILLLQSLVAARRDPHPGRAVSRTLRGLAAVGIGALLVVVAMYAPLTARMDPNHQRVVIHEMVAGRGAPKLSAAIESVVPFSRPLAHYLGGLASVLRQNVVGGGVNYLFGKSSVHGFPFYFFAAFALKSTIAFLVVTAMTLAFFLRRPAAFSEEARLFLLPPAVLFLSSVGSAYNIGIRHMLPVYPFLALAGASVFARVARRRGPHERVNPAAAALLVLPLLCGYELIRIHPHELSYFNPLAGGPENGRKLLSDSNVDWGLDLKRLARELARRGAARPTIVYFGGDDVLYRTGVPDFAAEPRVQPGLVAISAFQLAVGPEFHEYHGAHDVAAALRALNAQIAARGRPVGRVGYSIYLFDLPSVPRPSSPAERTTPRTPGPRDDNR